MSLEDFEEEIAESVIELRRLRGKIETLKADLAKAQQQTVDDEATIARLKAEVESSRQNALDCKQAWRNLQTEVEALKETVSAQESELEIFAEATRAGLRTLDQRESEVDELRQQAGWLAIAAIEQKLPTIQRVFDSFMEDGPEEGIEQHLEALIETAAREASDS